MTLDGNSDYLDLVPFNYQLGTKKHFMSENKTAILKTTATPQLKDILRKEAQRRNQKLSAFIRLVLKNYVREKGLKA